MAEATRKKEKRNPFLQISSIRKKMLMIFAVLLAVFGVGLAALITYIYGKGFTHLSEAYLSDVTEQTANNLEKMITDIEDMTVEILTNSVIQDELRYTNKNELSSYMKRNISQRVGSELEHQFLYDPNIVSMTIVSKSGEVYNLTSLDGRPIDYAFTEEDIYEANGTTLWGLGENNNVCVAKAILDLKTMMPLGYMNIVYKRAYFEAVVQDNATEYSGDVYVIDGDGRILTSNRREFIDEIYPDSVEELLTYHGYRHDPLLNQKAFFYVGDEISNGWILLETVSAEEYNKSYRQMLYTIIPFFLVILALGFVGIRIAAGYIMKPTRDLVESMKQFGEGNLSHRVKVTTRDEIGQIGTEYNRMADNIENLIEQVYMMEIAQKQAEIDFLCMQINPHFLYNTLDTISWMAIADGREDISELTIALAELLRAMVKSERFITVKEELETVREYLLIQEQRFEDKIRVEYQVEEAVYPFYIPNLTLQPLIENAIIHGLEPKMGPGVLRICIRMEDDRLAFSIEDDGVGMTEEEIRVLYEKCRAKNMTESIGLKNVYRRLVLYYGAGSSLVITSEKDVGTKISFTVPAENQPRELKTMHTNNDIRRSKANEKNTEF